MDRLDGGYFLHCEVLLLAAIACLLASLVVSFWLTARFSRPGSLLYILDHPNARSLHFRPTPRSGGVAIVVAVYGVGAVALAGTGALWLIPLAVAGVVLAVVAFIDDRAKLSAASRMAVHVVVAIGLVLLGFRLLALELPGMEWVLPEWLGVALSAGFIVWMINLYNFMDGMDGFAGGMGVIGFGTLGLLGGWQGDTGFALVSAIIASACAGFLLVNFPPARIFMGDVGSATLGCFAAGLIIWGGERGIFPFWAGLLIFSPFIADATVTLLRRLVRGEKVWQAHRTHYYQRLVQLGWGHKKTVLFQYALMLVCALGAVSAIRASERVQWAVILAAVAVYALYFMGVRFLENHHFQAASPRPPRRQS